MNHSHALLNQTMHIRTDHQNGKPNSIVVSSFLLERVTLKQVEGEGEGYKISPRHDGGLRIWVAEKVAVTWHPKVWAQIEKLHSSFTHNGRRKCYYTNSWVSAISKSSAQYQHRLTLTHTHTHAVIQGLHRYSFILLLSLNEENALLFSHSIYFEYRRLSFESFRK